MTDSGWVALAISIAVGFFAYLGALRAREANRIALYDRRLALFRAVQAELSDTVRKGDASLENADRLLDPLQEARFLFPKQVAKYIESMRNNMLTLHFTEQAVRLHRGPNNEAELDRRHRAFKALLEDMNSLFVVFVPVTHVSEWTARDSLAELRLFGSRMSDKLRERAEENRIVAE